MLSIHEPALAGNKNRKNICPWTEALKLAQRGIPVFPCGPDKRPLTPNGFKDASADPDIVHDWWVRCPDALIGVPAGPKFVVIDLDLQHADAQQWHADNRYRMALSRKHRTPSGGLHVLHAPHDGVKCSASKLGPHIDTRGHGGYIIWWPACGLEVLHRDVLAPVPEWIVDALNPKPRPMAQGVGITASRICANSPSAASLRGALKVLAGAKEGERNHKLYWVACRIGEAVRRGTLTEPQALDLLTSVGRSVGLLDREILVTARSAFQRG
jgi:hypothetical protein